MHDLDATRRSWNAATRNHNAHKGDQAAFLRGGGDVLFPDELELLGDMKGAALVHLQCNAGQDSLCLARRGADVVGVDLSDEAVAFAQALSADAGIPAWFVEADVCAWLHETDARFDIAFSSYGACGWLPDLARWATGIARVLRAGGRFVYVEFHPVLWSVDDDLRLAGDDYFAADPFVAPVGDYVAASGAALGAIAPAPVVANRVAAQSWQHGVGAVVSALAEAGLRIEVLREYPYANGCKVNPALVPAPRSADPADARRWVWPPTAARLPLMYGLVARKPY